MRFATWEPVYEAIIADFGYDRAADERARDVLAELTEPFDHQRLPPMGAATVAIAGGAASLTDDLALVGNADVVIAASIAADRLLAAEIVPDVLCTDLDGTPETARELSERGIPVVVHAHGDNIPAVREWVPRFEPASVLPTTQAAPAGPVENFGGFTDGDRAAFLADHVGASALVFPGWDFDDPTVDRDKRRKLDWAERLLRWIELRRDERFAVLDGRREGIDTAGLPI